MPQLSIRFHNADIRFSLKNKKDVNLFLENQLKVTCKQVELNYIFCSDDYLLDINRRFLNHDFYTDIITFPLSTTKEFLEAEIYISVDRVKENAKELQVDFQQELLRVIFHGVLHLLGHKDKTQAQKVDMRKTEDKWLKMFLNI